LPKSFFEPPVDVGAVASRIKGAILKGGGGGAPASAAHPSGGVARGSGIQITPDELRILISKDVADERWAITRNLDDLTVTGNVFFPEGGPPLFVFCEQIGETAEDVELA